MFTCIKKHSLLTYLQVFSKISVFIFICVYKNTSSSLSMPNEAFSCTWIPLWISAITQHPPPPISCVATRRNKQDILFSSVILSLRFTMSYMCLSISSVLSLWLTIWHIHMVKRNIWSPFHSSLLLCRSDAHLEPYLDWPDILDIIPPYRKDL